MDEQLELFQTGAPAARRNADELHTELSAFQEFGTETLVTETSVDGLAPTSTYVNEFWTSKQRAAHSLHELSYRACFKPQLPRFFIERLTGVGDVVYDPFMDEKNAENFAFSFMDLADFACFGHGLDP